MGASGSRIVPHAARAVLINPKTRRSRKGDWLARVPHRRRPDAGFVRTQTLKQIAIAMAAI